MGLNAASILGVKEELTDDSCATLTLKRIFPVLSSKDGNVDEGSTTSNNKKIRFKSTCSINGYVVTLKALKLVGAPLVAIVDAPAAAAALKQPQSRLRMIDTAVPSVVLLWVSQLQNKFKKFKSHRESLERELASRVLPPSFTAINYGNKAANDDDDNALLRHWVEELDGFEARISSFCSSIVADTEQRLGSGAGVSLTTCLEGLETFSWMDNTNDGRTGNNISRTTFSSAMYETLLDLADTLKELEGQIEAANNAYQTLASLSDAKSAITAVERARDFLMDATAGKEFSSNDKSKAMVAAERAHDLLNQVEDALSACSRFLEDDDKGLLGALQAERGACPVTVEKINEMIGEWNTLSRKHGIAPHILPSCHAALRQEYNGNVEAKTLLPKALEDENKALKELEQACEVLSQARLEVSSRLTASITRRLPILGMEGSTFEARVDPKRRVPGDIAAGSLGVDAVDFVLSHNSNGHNAIVLSENESETSPAPYQGGKLENVASSGEKARILLAIECEIPGSVSSLCGGITAASKTGEQEEEDGGVGRGGDDEGALVPPVAAIYDEIDAHVGGRAAVSVAQMLSEQSHACQVMTITHSPSVAAIADSHVVIQKQYLTGRRRQGAVTVACVVEGTRRRQELARMASGDLAPEEAETFAEALMRHGGANKQRI
jgi:DNA repair ATPase RecN